MANSDKDIIITPNRGSSADDPKVEYRGANSSVGPQTITSRVYPTSNGTLSFEGSAGQLFSITNSLTGTLFSVNDVSGLPSLEVIDTGVVRLAQYSGRVLLGNVTDDGFLALQINGGLRTSMMWVNFSSANYNNYNEGIRLYEAGNGAAVMTFNTPGTTGSSYSSIIGYTDRQERRWAGQWQDRLYNGYMEAYGSYRAPVFYDSDNTDYRIDPRSTSRLSGLRLDGIDNEASGTDAILWINKPNNNDWAMIVSGGLEYGIDLQMASSHSYAIRAQKAGSEYSRLGSDLFYHATEIRAPIFRDYSNPSSYYLDPDGTSQLYRVNARRIAVNPDQNTSSATTGTLSLWDNPDVTTSTLMFKRTDELFGTHGAVDGTYATFWNMDTTNRGWIFRYATSTTAGSNVFSIRNDNGTTTIGNGGFTPGNVFARLNVHAGSSTSSTFRDIDLYGGWNSGEGHAITAMYGTSSTSIVGQMVFEHNSPGSRIKWGRLYHSGNQSTYPMQFISDGSSAYLEINDGSMRAPIFYDYQDTSFFIDPTGASTVKYIEGSNWASFRGANQAINDWNYSGLSVNPTVSSYSDGSWYMQSTAGDWERGLLSKRRFRRVEGLTFECEILAYSPATLMFGFAGGDTTSYSYCQTPTNLVYLADGSIYVYENCSGLGTVYSFDYRNAWWRFKVVLKGSGANYYVHKDGKWNSILSTSNNDQSNYEWVRVLFSNYYTPNNVVIRDAKVYVDHGYRGITYMHPISGYGIASTAFQAPRFEDTDNTAWFVDPASGSSFLSKLRLNNTSGPSDSTYGTAASVPLHISGADKVNTTILVENTTNSSLEYPHLIIRRTATPTLNRFGCFIRFADKNSSGTEVYTGLYSFNRLTYQDITLEAGGTDDRVQLRTGSSTNIIVGQNYVTHLKAGIYNVTTPAALDIDCREGNYFIKTISADSTFTFSNVQVPSGFTVAYSFTLELTHTSGTVTWPASVKWPGNTAPSLTTGKTHLFMFVTDDGGTTFRGAALTNYNN